MKQIYFTKHSKNKTALLSNYGFILSQEYISSVVREPDKVLLKGNQKIFLKIYDTEHLIQVVCEETEDYIKIITVFPSRRRRYGI